MRKIAAETVVGAVRDMCIRGCIEADPALLEKLRLTLKRETGPIAGDILAQLLENAAIAGRERLPLCQDTGVAVFFVEFGSDVRIVGGELIDCINEGVRRGYADGFLRKSVVADPLRRTNTGDNTPAIIHVEPVPGEGLKIAYAAKGGGSENMSAVRMLKPADGVEGVREFVLAHVRGSGGNPCPPLVVGVGIGGNFEKCAILAKKALFRTPGAANPDPFYAALETKLLDEINTLGIGPMGLGGDTTALAVHIETAPCHIASLPVAVNLNCHSARHMEVVL